MLDIMLKTIPANLVRAEQSGDWSYGSVAILASVIEGTYPPDNELMIVIHEVVEAWLCRRAGITEAAVVKFDEMYEDERKAGHHTKDDEPGDDPRSPYRIQHQAATHVERAVGAALDVSWTEHERLVSGSEAAHPKTSSPDSQPPQPDPGRPRGSLREDQSCSPSPSHSSSSLS